MLLVWSLDRLYRSQVAPPCVQICAVVRTWARAGPHLAVWMQVVEVRPPQALLPSHREQDRSQRCPNYLILRSPLEL